MNILEGLNGPQEQAVKHFKGPLLILAGAGSGKTRVLTHRIAYLINEYRVNPWNILAITFTNKAASEMRERVDNIVGENASSIWVSTFHSTCARILRRYIEPLGYTRSYTIYDSDDQKTLMREIIKYLNLDPKKYKERAFLNAISSAKDELISPEQYELRASGDLMKQTYARAYREYEKRLHASNALDFDDLIVKTIQLFKENPDILGFYQNRFKYIMVDEYQDTNTAQFELIRILAETKGEDGSTEHNLCVVGDDDQSIYKFRGANIYNILNFEQSYPDTHVIRLEENYRSTGNILDAANAVIKNNSMRKEKSLWTQKGGGDLIYYSQFFNEYEEAENITDDIAHAVSSASADYKDFAILYRTNAQSRVFEEKLVMHNIPYKIVGALNFYQRKEIKDMLAYLRTIDNGLDDMSVKRIINVPKRGIGLTTIDRISAYAAEHELSFYDALQNCEYIDGIGRGINKLTSFVSLIESFKRHLQMPGYGIEDLMNEIIEETKYVELLKEEDTDEANGRIENIEELLNKITAYEQNNENPTLGGFLEEVALVADIDNVDESNNIVLLMTLHSAKGLEFPYVYLAGMEDGIFPGYAAVSGDDPEEMEEERRLCYVGITRAKEKLSISCAKTRFRHGEQQFYRPSRFIYEIPRYLLKQEIDTESSIFGQQKQPDKPTKSFNSSQNNYFDTKQYANPFSQNRRPDVGQSSTYGNQKQSDVKQPSVNAANTWNPLAQKAAMQSGHRQQGLSGKELLENNPLITKGFKSPYSVSTEPKGTVTVNYKEGDRVKHIKFGEGTVKTLIEKSGDYEVTVEFDSGTTRKMIASFAKLKKV